MRDPLTNGWVQLVIAAGSVFSLICFYIAVRNSTLRFPKPSLS